MIDTEFGRQVYGAVSVDWKRVEEIVEQSGLAADYDEVVSITDDLEIEIQDGVESGAAAVFDAHTRR